MGAPKRSKFELTTGKRLLNGYKPMKLAIQTTEKGIRFEAQCAPSDNISSTTTHSHDKEQICVAGIDGRRLETESGLSARWLLRASPSVYSQVIRKVSRLEGRLLVSSIVSSFRRRVSFPVLGKRVLLIMSAACADDLDGTDIPAGAMLTNKTLKYRFVEKIGSGGYGAVYKVQLDPSDNKEYAMKIEKKLERREHSKLNMEVHILKLMAHKPDDKTHFLKMYDRGKKEKFFFIVMTLVGDSLLDLKRQRSTGAFSPATGIKVARQCLEAIGELHDCGFIHRDIKPGNYAVGRPPLHCTVYILDFGIARRFVNDAGEVKAPRVKVHFKGTVRYASLSCHKGKENGPKDDCEAWLYMMIDLCNPEGVTWRRVLDREKVFELKEEARTQKGKERIFKDMAVNEWSTMMDYIDKLGYQDKVDYAYLYQMLDEGAKTLKADMAAPYDWDTSHQKEGDASQSMVGTQMSTTSQPSAKMVPMIPKRK
uniref:Protein kinase domain-containing protein n=1 Tax=Steinernema glaseri TaxID=37863 RepID=A0A1I7Z0H5_9BILA